MSPVPVPPHVFQISSGEVRYSAFARSNGSSTRPPGLEAGAVLQVGLPEDTFGTGPLGGTVREASGLDRALEELVRGAGSGLKGASLVVPDRWFRLLFTDSEKVPKRDREEIWRWKLKSLVPFRVEDLRVQGVAVSAVAPTEGGIERVLLAFAVEQLMRELEEAFERRGIHVGQITSRSLALLNLLSQRGENAIIVQVDEDGYSTFFLSGSAPVLVRYRAVALEPWSTEVEDDLLRDFRITRSFLNESLPGVRFGRGLFCGPPSALENWGRVLEESFEVTTHLLGPEDLPVVGAPADTDWHRLAPMVAAAALEIT
ncbi:MAG: hypothetical protein VYE73_05370 [Acidobacteriota bacterium]|nr:hypothetical protein [Acidobacteriota bacterium]